MEHADLRTCQPRKNLVVVEGNWNKSELDEREGKWETYVERFDTLIEAWFDTFSHQTAAAAAAEVMLYSLFSEAVFLYRC